MLVRPGECKCDWAEWKSPEKRSPLSILQIQEGCVETDFVESTPQICRLVSLKKIAETKSRELYFSMYKLKVDLSSAGDGSEMDEENGAAFFQGRKGSDRFYELLHVWDGGGEIAIGKAEVTKSKYGPLVVLHMTSGQHVRDDLFLMETDDTGFINYLDLPKGYSVETDLPDLNDGIYRAPVLVPGEAHGACYNGSCWAEGGRIEATLTLIRRALVIRSQRYIPPQPQKWPAWFKPVRPPSGFRP
jgi:hypothetical protein